MQAAIYDPETGKVKSTVTATPQFMERVTHWVKIPANLVSEVEGEPGAWMVSDNVLTRVGRVPDEEEITAERDRRINRGVLFKGELIRMRLEDRVRITNASVHAVAAINLGAQRDDYLWHGGTDAFAVIAANGTVVPMDAYETINLAKKLMVRENKLVLVAEGLKQNRDTVTDYKSNTHWPSTS